MGGCRLLCDYSIVTKLGGGGGGGGGGGVCRLLCDYSIVTKLAHPDLIMNLKNIVIFRWQKFRKHLMSMHLSGIWRKAINYQDTEAWTTCPTCFTWCLYIYILSRMSLSFTEIALAFVRRIPSWQSVSISSGAPLLIWFNLNPGMDK